MSVLTQPTYDISVSREVAAPPGEVYAIVTDLSRVGELSPETVAARWVSGDRACVGARFRGRNRLGLVTWSTTATVLAAEPGRRFAYETSAPSRSTWTWSLEPVAGGTRVTESMRKDDEQPAPVRLLQRLAGVRDRRAHLRAGMTTTLERLAVAAEDR